MSRERYIELGLQASVGGDPLVSALRPVVDRALAVLADAIRSGEEHEDGVKRGDVLGEIARCRQLMNEVDAPEPIERASSHLFSACEQTLRHIEAPREANGNRLAHQVGARSRRHHCR